MNVLKELGQWSFRSFRRIIYIYVDSVKIRKLEDMPICDKRFLECYLIVCKHVNSRTEWGEVTKNRFKKAVLILCSKFSRDTAYRDMLLSIAREVTQKKIF